MMRFYYFIFGIFILYAFFLNGCSTGEYTVDSTVNSDSIFVFKRYSPQELKGDLNYLFSRMEEIHPNLYARTTKEKIIKEKETIENQLNTPLTRIEFYRLINHFISGFNDGHSFLFWPVEEFEYFNKSGGKFFPFEISINEENGVILHNYSEDSTFKKGYSIRSINGITFKEIKDSLLKHLSYEREVKRIHVLGNTFYKWLYIVYGFKNNFRIEYSIPGISEIKNKSVSGICLDSINIRKNRVNYFIDKALYSLATFPKEKIALLAFKNTANRNEFQAFLRNSFTKIKNDDITDLIIDIRANGGGSSQLSEDLLNYITEKPFKSFALSEIKPAALMRKPPWIRRWGISLGLYKLFYDSTNCRGCYVSNSKYLKPENNDLMFKGNIYLLISSATFSAGSGFAAIIKDFRIGEIIGQETGGLASSSGDYISFKLPATSIEASVSTTFFLRPAGYDDGRGVIPDYEVIPSIEDKLKGIDTELGFARKLIIEKHNK